MSAASPSTVPERTDVVEVLHGVSVADPYRYLEDPDDPRTTAFIEAQNAVSAPGLAALPSRRYFGEQTWQLLTAPRAGVPFERGGRYFRLQNPGELDQDVLVTAPDLDTLLREPTVLLDPNTLSADGTIALNGLSASPDGALLAVALSEAGSDWQTIVFIRTAGEQAGERLPDELRWSKFGAPTWLPDSSGVLYWRYPAPTGQVYVDQLPPGELVRHRLGTGQDGDERIWFRDDASGGAQWMVHAEFSADDRWLLLTSAPGTDSRSLLEVRPVGPDGELGDPTVLVGELTDAWYPVEVVGDEVLVLTDAGAPRRRLVALPLSGDGGLREVIGEHDDATLVDVTPAGGRLVVVRSVDTAHEVTVAAVTGQELGRIPLAGPAAVLGVSARWRSDEVFVGSTSFTTRIAVQRVELSDGAPRATPLPATPPGATTAAPPLAVVAERRAGTSADGTRVPMTVVRRADLTGGGPRPTLLYGYGGFDIPMVPSFSALLASWVAAGGVVAVANLRGGGEFGQDWHRAGMLHDKQRVFDDLYGCAEALIADGTTTSAQLAVHGRSNGGLLVGAALTQRPELWAATLPTVGVLDMVRFHRFTIGAAWTTEYGNPDDPADFPVVLAYSPLHALQEGRSYPATLVCTGDHDDRVVPAHSLKFAAELLHCQGGDAPVWLRVDTRAGHGMGKPVRALAAEYADQLAFAAEHTGLVPQWTAV